MAAINQNYDVIIIGAGAAGLMCAIESGKRGRKTLLIDHSKNPAEKIRISGGGRCNFTNLNTLPANFISQNPRFCVSALTRYTQHDFIEIIEKHRIKYHEKTLGQLFCDESSKLIINMLLQECELAKVDILLDTKIIKIKPLYSDNKNFEISTLDNTTQNAIKYQAESVVMATGGLSIPKMGATGFGYDIARQFGLNIIQPSAALVPFTFEGEMLEYSKSMAGTAVDGQVNCDGVNFDEALLFTHKGLSGPAILQISSYWELGKKVSVNLARNIDIFEHLKGERNKNPKLNIQTTLSKILPKKLAAKICEQNGFSQKLADCSNQTLQKISKNVNDWQFIPAGTEGYRTAEVTLGGVDTGEVSSKTFEAKKAKGLYFIGEVLDVTGWLGGYNFQWAWSSGYACGQYV